MAPSTVLFWKGFPLALKFRTLDILLGSAPDQMRGVDLSTCNFCHGPEVGHGHLVLSCPATAHLRDAARSLSLKSASTFTRCTGVPTMVSELPRSGTSPGVWPFYEWGTCLCFHRRVCKPPKLPTVRMPSWAVRIGDVWLGDVRPHIAGITPGSHHDICRAETYAVLSCVLGNHRTGHHIL